MLAAIICGPPGVLRPPALRSGRAAMGISDLFGGKAASGASGAAVTLPADSAPSWVDLKAAVAATPAGEMLGEERALQAKGLGPPHTDARLRLFGAKSESEVRVTLFRDTAAWCPYCQKVWLLLEEKRIPYRLDKINMRSYGDKPRWFLDKVPNGLLPAIEIDGNFMTDSLPIMQALDQTFSGEGTPRMVPPPGPERDRASKLLGLERELFGAWCSLTFQPGKGLMDRNERAFMATLRRVDEALGESAGPWFLDSADHPTLVDLQYVSHVERMLASALYWKGIQIRGSGRFSNLEAWLAAFEERPAYLATKSDYYTHVMDIPPQYGPGFSVDEATSPPISPLSPPISLKRYLQAIHRTAPHEPRSGLRIPAREAAAAIDGRGGSWSLPLDLQGSAFEPLAPLQAALGDAAARHEAARRALAGLASAGPVRDILEASLQAAFELVANHAAVVRFAARGTGAPGRKRFQAPLADPYATPNEQAVAAVDVCLRHVAAALISGAEETAAAAEADLAAVKGADGGRALSACLIYLRDRIGVPRDMSQPAAMNLRAHLNALIALC
ncbi:glutathione dehydrogenase [Emiliania huxleyi CCMP1516]|uniref:GST N-terminal domain-containing protein n=2 Tax=Emiliania huxleyi TaxID=2903 RepID=A0A0D3JT16_EMIH1|nr:glutathione dehydrogenase [Emiliania huxleyi CCMP1516]EOD26651.1 glutathione dehydrogenase [Emiliania huxleyi CCMP1516]|eukprot:XP_005779080.1 glutathione dehydrogenase [Emiliania huxleyi CCMP1516]